MLESRDLGLETAEFLCNMADKLGISLIYKASFDKANRSSINGVRGVGIDEAMDIFIEIKARFPCKIVTDIHESHQSKIVAEVVDLIQIPAMLCRQTDLVVSAAKTGLPINIKKGQFMSPTEMRNIVDKARQSGSENVMLCERGTFFGYNNLVSDMRSLPIMSSFGCPVIFDATHSIQKPGAGICESGGERWFAETLSRAAIAVGVAGLFVETHPRPEKALSDGACVIPMHSLEKFVSAMQKLDSASKKIAYQSFSYQQLS
ncbi:2-dehydro-3-deoxyphosphooctonate aldolase [Candidatus Hydrogenosomobacter endosymbioticus]|uniref:3-deoxy-8-phosphooctulonate synthase n=2 Tax=Candidatus Hydrogenosomobacter endosymbioticus TaxID=2558174 RepID=A0ABM7V9D3_9PROT|nr:2-dehydro-3-deoxyphosphooctonate aldolase [Candidatus Hydrogenosomobacter endosymbioticus]